MAQTLQKGNPWKGKWLHDMVRVIVSGRFLVRNKEGTPIPLIVTDYPIFDRNDSLVGILGVSCVDTSESADLLLPNDQKFGGASGKSVLIVSAEGSLIRWCNDTFLRDIGCSSVEQVLGRPLQEFCHPQADECCEVPKISNGCTVTIRAGIRSVNLYRMRPSNMHVVTLLDANP